MTTVIQESDSSAEEAAEEVAEEVSESVEEAGEEVAEAVEQSITTAVDLNHESRITRLETIQEQHTAAITGLTEAVTALSAIEQVQNDVIEEVAEVAQEAATEAVIAEATAEAAAEEAAEVPATSEDEAPTSKENWFFKRRSRK